MKKIITSFAIQSVAEGKRTTASYSIIDQNGAYIKQNQRFTFIETDEKMLEAINTLEEALTAKIPE